MRIIEAEPQLIRDILDELHVLESHEKEQYTVHLGRHPLLGRMVVISSPEDDVGGVVVEME